MSSGLIVERFPSEFGWLALFLELLMVFRVCWSNGKERGKEGVPGLAKPFGRITLP